jgi:hypothetical protein
MAIPDVSTTHIYEGELPNVDSMSEVTHVRVITATGSGSEKVPIDEFKLPASQINNDSSVAGATVDDALTQLNTDKASSESVELADSEFYAKAIEPIAHNATAPTPVIPTGTTKTYEFSSGGVCAWLANQVVEKGDKVTVAFTAPSTFTRTYQNVVSRKVDDSQIKQTTGTSETDVMSQMSVSNISALLTLLFKANRITTTFANGFINTSGVFVSAVSDYWSSGFIQVTAGLSYYIAGSGSSSVLVVSAYSSNSEASFLTGNAINKPGSDKFSVYSVVIPSGVSYVRITLNKAYGEQYNHGVFLLSNGGIFRDVQSNKIETSEVKQVLGQSLTALISQKATTDILDGISNKSMLLTLNTDGNNIFDKTYIRTGKAIHSSTFKIVDYTSQNIVITGYYKIPSTASKLQISGVVDATGNGVTVRLCKDTTDDSDSIGYTIDSTKGSATITLTESSKVYQYLVVTVFRGVTGSTPLLDNVKIAFNNAAYEKKNYVKARRPIVSFTLDNDNWLNADYKAIFANHNVKVGFALRYIAPFGRISQQTYLQWQLEGHEILTHGNYNFVDNPPEGLTIEQSVKDSYNDMISYGFNVKSYVASQGTYPSESLYLLKRYFNSAASKSNHGGSAYPIDLQESCIIYGTDKPYELWRYSMQAATLEEQKAAVDRAISQNALLMFYGHAESLNIGNFTTANLDSLLTYIEGKADEITIKTPSDSIDEYFSVRYDDIVGLI